MSRATQLNFRPPAEITNAIYNPSVTSTGNQLSFKTRHVSCDKIQKVLPFRSSTERLPIYRKIEKDHSPFVGPQAYEVAQSFTKLHAQPTPAIYKQDENSGGTECFTILDGGRRIYTPAWQRAGERTMIEGLTKDEWILPRGPIPKTLAATQSLLNNT